MQPPPPDCSVVRLPLRRESKAPRVRYRKRAGGHQGNHSRFDRRNGSAPMERSRSGWTRTECTVGPPLSSIRTTRASITRGRRTPSRLRWMTRNRSAKSGDTRRARGSSYYDDPCPVISTRSIFIYNPFFIKWVTGQTGAFGGRTDCSDGIPIVAAPTKRSTRRGNAGGSSRMALRSSGMPTGERRSFGQSSPPLYTRDFPDSR